MKIFATVILGLLLVVPHHGMAQEGGHDMHAEGHGHGVSKSLMQKTARTDADLALYNVTKNMHQTMDVPLIGPADADFVRTMIPHHQGAIDMAKVVIQYGHDEDVRKLAERITRAQTWEISWMKRLLGRMGQGNVTASIGAMEKSATTPEKTELLNIHHDMHAAMDVQLTGNADCDFVRSMIPHHQGAVKMSYWVLGYGYQEDVQDLARDIIRAQGVEIAWMRKWLEGHTCSRDDSYKHENDHH